MASLMAEFATPEALVEAIVKLRSSGHTKLEAYTPFPVPAVEEALQLKPSWIPRVVLVGGLIGVALGFGLQWILNGVVYPLLVGGFPPRAAFPFVPITFETMILCAVLSALAGLLIATRLPKLWHPTFEVEGFTSATRDGFWLAAEGVNTSEITGATRVLEAPDGVA
jgi:hypothetical protein